MFPIIENVLHDHRQKYTVLCNDINYILLLLLRLLGHTYWQTFLTSPDSIGNIDTPTS